MATEPAQHTETPWTVTWSVDQDKGTFHIPEATGSRITSEIEDANAAFIQRACNSHEGLLAACKAIICEGGQGNTVYGDSDHISLNDSIWMCQHAVDKAEGRPLMPRPKRGRSHDQPRSFW